MSDNIFKRKTIMIDDDDDEVIIKEKIAQNQKIPSNNNKPHDKTEHNSKNIKIPSHPVDSKPNTNKNSNGTVKNTDSKKVNLNSDKKAVNNSSSKPIVNNTQPSEKVLNKKRKKVSSESSESSDEESDSQDSESDDSSSESESRSESVSKKKKVNKVKNNKAQSDPKEKAKPVLKTKESLVHQFLKRWWYAYSWPNKEDYSEELKANKLRKVEVYNWRIEREVDDKGLIKCIELSGFKGVFRDSKGILYDFRPKEMCPSYENFMKKDEKKIYDFLIKALQEQIKALESSEKYSNQDENILESIKEELQLTLENYNKKFK